MTRTLPSSLESSCPSPVTPEFGRGIGAESQQLPALDCVVVERRYTRPTPDGRARAAAASTTTSQAGFRSRISGLGALVPASGVWPSPSFAMYSLANARSPVRLERWLSSNTRYVKPTLNCRWASEQECIIDSGSRHPIYAVSYRGPFQTVVNIEFEDLTVRDFVCSNDFTSKYEGRPRHFFFERFMSWRQIYAGVGLVCKCQICSTSQENDYDDLGDESRRDRQERSAGDDGTTLLARGVLGTLSTEIHGRRLCLASRGVTTWLRCQDSR